VTNEKEVVIVTGASQGIGKAIALKLASNGMEVIPFGRNVKRTKEVGSLLKKYGTGEVYYCGDVADSGFVNKSVKEIIKRFKRVDHLVNNAGTAIFKKFIDSGLDEFKKQIDTNVYGVYNFSKAVSSHFVKRNSGSIINISSLAGKNSFKGGTMYSATKHAVQGFTKSLMLELREYNIRVALVCPGTVATELINGTLMQPKNIEKVLIPEDVADVVWGIIKLPPRALISEVEVRPTNPG
jgi:3-oxoacyl-[acyl-carrier protein] reductase